MSDVTVTDTIVRENEGPATVTLLRTGVVSNIATVRLTTRPGSAFGKGP